MSRRAERQYSYRTPIKVGGETITFELEPISLDERRQLMADTQSLDLKKGDVLGQVMDIAARHIIAVGDEGGSAREVIGEYEFIEDVWDVINGIVEFASLTREEAANLRYSPGQLSPGPVENAETNASSDNEPVSTTPTTEQ